MLIRPTGSQLQTFNRTHTASSRQMERAEPGAQTDAVDLQGGPEAAPSASGLGQQGHQSAASTAGAATGLPGAGLISPPCPETTAQLEQELGPHPFHIPRAQAESLAREHDMSMDQLMVELIPVAQQNARPPVSKYKVGACGQGKSGDLYLGVNLEMPNEALNQSVHGEQFVTANALAHGEAGLSKLAVSAEPCGHCRQFLNELDHGSELEILIAGKKPVPLKTLLPRNFGPEDLGVKGALLASPAFDLGLDRPSHDPAVNAALKAAEHSYAPYSKCPSGVAIEANGKVYANGYAENAAFNPSLSPLQSALVELVADGASYKDIDRVVLVEKKQTAPDQVSQEGISRLVLKSIAPDARFEVHHAHQS